MFFRKKEKEEFLEKLEQKFQTLEEKILKANQENLAAAGRIGDICQQISSLQSAVQKHDMAIEDLLDEWETKRSDEDDIQKHFRQYEQNENLLLELFETYNEQLWNLKRFAGTKDETWAGQIALMEKSLEPIRQRCGIIMIDNCKGTVDYELHEVIEVIDTTDPAQDKLIAGIYCCGYIYKGTVKRKAQVSAYRTAKSS